MGVRGFSITHESDYINKKEIFLQYTAIFLRESI